jgi:flagellar secretion chaperone FliS
MISNPYQKYQQSSVQTAPPGQLLVMLYDGAIRFTKAGIEGIESRDYEKANYNLQKAQVIIHEFIASLNFDYPISNNLMQVYEYMLYQLIQSNTYKKAASANEVLGYLMELRESWAKAARVQPDLAGNQHG